MPTACLNCAKLRLRIHRMNVEAATKRLEVAAQEHLIVTLRKKLSQALNHFLNHTTALTDFYVGDDMVGQGIAANDLFF